MKIILNGSNGRMGQAVQKKAVLHEIIGVDKLSATYPTLNSYSGEADVIIDFSHHSATAELVAYAISKKLPLVIATTGQTEEEKSLINEASKSIPVFFSYNMSIGIAVLADSAKKIASVMPNAEIEIVETHHDQKLDAPSGTALLLAKAIKEVRSDSNIVTGRSGHGKRDPKEIGIQSIRIGNIVGIHEIIISTGLESITLKHEAYDRSLFADGAIKAAEFIVGKEPGIYEMKDTLE
ncbi:MAG: 4-hydroxy-tetrahydrodipicolinate reductase [Bacilli bacterium]|nr:4-hydroxy-tetrahydrodipicolinate reductase [Bacilli bacterium]